ncbi:DUF6877 family protein [Lysinibacillus capsici]|uniref:DUF6877 family protein n=1 Tax=Lysinibacillus capsici TaxID=2115968 RepID=UPI003D74C9FF
MTIDEVVDRINQLIHEYEFPILVLQDVQKRLVDSNCPHYAMQQLRYLENNINAGIAKRKEVLN